MDGNFRFRFGSPGSRDGHFQFPSGVAVTSEGNIVVADTMNNRIQVNRDIKSGFEIFYKTVEENKPSN